MKFRIKNRKNLRSTKKGDSFGNKKKRVKSVKLTNPSKTKEKREKRQISITGMK